jgi:hypothetical protein
MFRRDTGETRQFWTHATVAGKRFGARKPTGSSEAAASFQDDLRPVPTVVSLPPAVGGSTWRLHAIFCGA